MGLIQDFEVDFPPQNTELGRWNLASSIAVLVYSKSIDLLTLSFMNIHARLNPLWIII